MKVMLISMVLLLLCSAQVLTLKCYTCDGENDKICKTETVCPPLKDYCRTYQKGDVFSRSCESLCAEDYFTTCCTTDLC
ncbi:hypothetical protein OJAV_G00126960 [Oryzias javanicus]|uniref:UPAR/Ly6 domain-containing protein n=1 Tax=Oryzias javanicus TaxID=123683 RepID=A0A3S2PEC3_ORYJA|nr:hypothetical protein OJAV_G00126960 [Oryzias javanicus]